MEAPGGMLKNLAVNTGNGECLCISREQQVPVVTNRKVIGVATSMTILVRK